LFNLYSECLTKEALDGLGDFKVGGKIIQTVKYADDLVLMAKEETVLQGMIDKLIKTGRYYGMEINVEKTKVMRDLRTGSLTNGFSTFGKKNYYSKSSYYRKVFLNYNLA